MKLFTILQRTRLYLSRVNIVLYIRQFKPAPSVGKYFWTMPISEPNASNRDTEIIAK